MEVVIKTIRHKNGKAIYLDYNATTPIEADVVEHIKQFMDATPPASTLPVNLTGMPWKMPESNWPYS